VIFIKKYYTSITRYRIGETILPFSMMLYLFAMHFYSGDETDFISILNQFTYFMCVVGIIFLTIHLVRVYSKDAYFGIGPKNMINKLFKREMKYEYSDAEFYTVKRSGKGINIIYKSIKSGKKVRVGLYVFEIDVDEFIDLLIKYSGKDVYYKDYGEEPRLMNEKTNLL